MAKVYTRVWRPAAVGRCIQLLFFSAWPLLLWSLPRASTLQFTRGDFPDDFAFGAATSAYQYEGAAAEDGRSPGIWDTYAHSERNTFKDTGDIASDGYHKYKDDIKLMSDIGLESYRFTIYWSRLIPGGRGAVNPEGLQFYNNLIDELMKAGIQINVVLYHIDLPQILEDEYSVWVSPKIMQNYQVSSLLAHASTVRLYRQNYQAAQKGTIGLNMYTMGLYPFTDSAEDIEATERVKTFLFGWILHPLVFGDYPETMRKIAGSRLPSFTSFESELVINSFDFIGLNHYTSIYVSNHPNALEGPLQDFTADLAALFRGTRDAPPSVMILPGEMVDPHGLELILEYICGNYGSLSFYIQENGYGEADDSLDDAERIAYLKKIHNEHTESHHVVKNGVDVRGYSVWSFMDLYEIFGGFKTHYGIVAVNFDTEERTRQLRRSAHWYS